MTTTPRVFRKQTTLRNSFTIRGTGMHTGQLAEVTVNPASANTGIQFVCGARRFPARASFVVNTRRCTSLGDGEAKLDTVEHFLSTMAGMQVDNAEVIVSGPEMPILDGSASPWVQEICGAGIKPLDAPRAILTIAEPVALRDGDSWMVATPAEHFSVTCVTQFDHPLLGTQAVKFGDNALEFSRQIAPSRTFGFAHEVEALKAAGLALGGSLNNALVIYDDHFSSPLRVENECLHHKVLDLFGDLSLAGALVHASITAVMPGHRINAAFAALLEEKGTWITE